MIRKKFRMRNVIAGAICLAASCGFVSCGDKCDKNDPKSSCYVKPTPIPDDSTTVETKIKDQDGNVYTEVTIGTQTWLKENLKTTKYQDGTPIANITQDAAWTSATSGAYCWYDNNVANKNTYGALYNFHVANSGKICPEGWHVPNNGEWIILIDNCGREATAGKNLKEAGTAHWSVDGGGNNEAGFTALPAGGREVNGTFSGLHDGTAFWTNVQTSPTEAEVLYLTAFTNSASTERVDVNSGASIRCIKDE